MVATDVGGAREAVIRLPDSLFHQTKRSSAISSLLNDGSGQDGLRRPEGCGTLSDTAQLAAVNSLTTSFLTDNVTEGSTALNNRPEENNKVRVCTFPAVVGGQTVQAGVARAARQCAGSIGRFSR